MAQVGYLVGGENARVKLKDISDDDIQPGFVLSPRGELAVKAVRKFEVPFALLRQPPTLAPLPPLLAICLPSASLPHSHLPLPPSFPPFRSTVFCPSPSLPLPPPIWTSLPFLTHLS